MNAPLLPGGVVQSLPHSPDSLRRVDKFSGDDCQHFPETKQFFAEIHFRIHPVGQVARSDFSSQLRERGPPQKPDREAGEPAGLRSPDFGALRWSPEIRSPGFQLPHWVP